MDQLSFMYEVLSEYGKLEKKIRSHIFTFTYIVFQGWRLGFSKELPNEQVAQLSGIFTANYATIPWPPVKNVYSDREKWVIVVNVLRSNSPEFNVTHFGAQSSSQIPNEVLLLLKQELHYYTECSPEAGKYKTM